MLECSTRQVGNPLCWVGVERCLHPTTDLETLAPEVGRINFASWSFRRAAAGVGPDTELRRRRTPYREMGMTCGLEKAGAEMTP